MSRLETRELEYAVALADELSFTRAAARLGMAQPPLSRAIGRLERRLTVTLFTRTSRAVAITEAGEAFIADARAILGHLDDAATRVRATKQNRPLVVALRPAGGSGLLHQILSQVTELDDPLPVRVKLTRDPVAAVNQRTADVALTCLSHDTAGLLTDELADRRTVVLLSTSHPFATQATLILADVQALPRFLPECPDLPLDEILDLVRLQCAAVLVSDDVANQMGDHIRAVPVIDAPHSSLGLAYQPTDSHPRLGELLSQARRAAYANSPSPSAASHRA